jgi:hypothetical protein
MTQAQIDEASRLAQEWNPKKEVYDHQTGVWLLVQKAK